MAVAAWKDITARAPRRSQISIFLLTAKNLGLGLHRYVEEKEQGEVTLSQEAIWINKAGKKQKSEDDMVVKPRGQTKTHGTQQQADLYMEEQLFEGLIYSLLEDEN